MEIKPCPFCGNEALSVLEWNNKSFVRCGKCYAYGPNGENEEKAIQLWNAAPRKEDEHMGGSCLNCKFCPCENKTPGTLWCSNWEEKEDTKMEQNCGSCKYNLDGYCGAVPPYKSFKVYGHLCCTDWEAKEPEPAPLTPSNSRGKPFIDLAQDELDVIRTLETKVNEYQMAAEEAAELAQAMLKYCRVYGHGSWTPMNPKDAEDAVIEEYADLLLAMEASFPRCEGNKMFYNNLERVYKEKAERWAERLKEQEGEEDDRDDQF